VRKIHTEQLGVHEFHSRSAVPLIDIKIILFNKIKGSFHFSWISWAALSVAYIYFLLIIYEQHLSNLSNKTGKLVRVTFTAKVFCVPSRYVAQIVGIETTANKVNSCLRRFVG